LVLPYFEQTAVYDEIIEYTMSTPYTDNDVNMGQLDESIEFLPYGHISIATLLCPSDSSNKYWEEGMSAFSNYKANSADLATLKADRVRRSWVIPAVRRGKQTSTHTLSAITDGLSNTILLSEGLVNNGENGFSPDGNSWSVYVGDADYRLFIATKSDLSPDSSTTSGGISGFYTRVPQNCMKVAGSNHKYQDSNQWVQRKGAGRIGREAFGDWVFNSRFHTLMPPNSPNCQMPDNWNYTWVSASSDHRGGVNVALMDGGVRFVPDTINTDNLHRGVSRQTDIPEEPPSSPYDENGIFSYGVWSELGAINSGKSPTLP
jgi:hypothetical protein